VEWLDVVLSPLEKPQVHDFAVIWDEDHDNRIINVIEHIYMAGLLSPIQFIGERKGCLTVIVAAKFYWSGDEEGLEAYSRNIQEITATAVNNDFWSTRIGQFDREPGSPHQTYLEGLIDADEHRVITYARNIDSLWRLGTRPFQPSPLQMAD
jgi:hypothetical protein